MNRSSDRLRTIVQDSGARVILTTSQISNRPSFHGLGLTIENIDQIERDSRSVLMSPMHFLQKPQRWLNVISRYKGTTSGGPNFAFDLCLNKIRGESIKDLDLNSWEVAFCGAELVNSSTLRKFSAFLKPLGFRENAFQPCYGMAEATLLISAAKYNSNLEIYQIPKRNLASNDNNSNNVFQNKELVGCGYPIECDIAIVDNHGAEVEKGRVGEIWVQSQSIAKGYWNKEDETGKVFEAHLTNGKGPFLRTGDLGYLKDDNLFIAGRIKELIIINDRNYYRIF